MFAFILSIRIIIYPICDNKSLLFANNKFINITNYKPFIFNFTNFSPFIIYFIYYFSYLFKAFIFFFIKLVI
jgi:hypothetical protein